MRAYLGDYDQGVVFSVEKTILWVEWRDEGGYLRPVSVDDARNLRDFLNNYLNEEAP